MATITETTKTVVLPPRTFTVELSEKELAMLVLNMGETSEYTMKEWVKQTLESKYEPEGLKAATILSEQGGVSTRYDLYAMFRDALNGGK